MKLRFNTGTGAWEVEAYGAWTPARYSPDQIRQGILSGVLQLTNPSDPGVPGRLAAMGIPVDATGAVQPAVGAGQAQVPAVQLQGALGQAMPTGSVMTPEGAMVRPAGQSAAAPVAPPTPAAPVQAEQGNNPGAVYNAQTNSWNVDPAAQWAARQQAPGAAAAPAAPAPPPVFNPDEGLTLEQQSQMAQQQFGQAGNPMSAEEYYAMLGGTPELRRFAEGGMMDEMMPGPNAITGEGMETATEQFDSPHRGEIILMPTGKPGNYDVRYTEGPVASALKPKSLIVPLPDSLEEEMKRELLPIEATPLKDTGNGELVDVTGQAYATGGVVPAPTLVAPPVASAYPDVWAGLQNTGFGNLQQYLTASDAAIERRDQELKFGGNLGGAQGARQRFSRLAPPIFSTGTWA